MSDSDPTTTVEYREIQDAPGYRIGSDGTPQSRWKRVGAGRGKGGRAVQSDTWVDLATSPSPSGHHYVTLGTGRRRLVHRLVLEAFVGPCPPGMECRHLNGDPSDNRVENLTWGTRTENVADMRRHGTWNAGAKPGSRNSAAKLNEEDVREIRRLNEARTMTIRRIAEQFGVAVGTIKDILYGRSWGHLP